MQKGAQILFKNNKLLISLWGQWIAEGYQEGNLFWIDTLNTSLHTISAAPTPLTLWHACIGHMSNQALKRYRDSVKGIILDPMEVNNDAPCTSCELGKQMQTFFPGSFKHSDQRLWIIHSDLTGLMQMRSIQGSSYIATFIDDYS
jgi:hypothetical protein